jgi:AraC family transcriptional regulator of adaptative response/methylated-DNA-[protein]-cysteine methyltransferase
VETQLSTREMHRAFKAADASYDGIFCVGVRTTGIFCRPSCAARKPKPENVEFFTTSRAALFSGYRPCKRCRPLDTDGTPPTWVGKLKDALGRSETKRLTAADLRRLGVDPARARRYFLRHHGMTFNAFTRAWRLNEAFRSLKSGSTVNEAAAAGGFESASGFRSAFSRVLGTTPSAAKRGASVTLTWLETPLGPMVAGATPDAVCFLEFSDRRMLEGQLKALQRRFGATPVPGTNALLAKLETELAEYFAGERRDFDLPLAHPGTPFQESVWSALRKIPYGSTCSYAAVAAQIGRRHAVRAVGTANGMNRIAILIPCHRVVNANGDLGGYGGGLWRKRRLLEIERGRDEVA